MSLDGYTRWSYDTLADDYNEDLKAYSGSDMSDAYQTGLGYKEANDKLEQENDALRALLGANVRVIKKELLEDFIKFCEEKTD